MISTTPVVLASERPIYPPQEECEPQDESQVINPVDVKADAGIDYLCCAFGLLFYIFSISISASSSLQTAPSQSFDFNF